MAFVCKQTAVMVVRINNIEHNNDVLTDFLAIFLTLYFTTYLSWPDLLYFYCFFSFKIFDPYYPSAVCCVPLTIQIPSLFERFYPCEVKWHRHLYLTNLVGQHSVDILSQLTWCRQEHKVRPPRLNRGQGHREVSF